MKPTIQSYLTGSKQDSQYNTQSLPYQLESSYELKGLCQSMAINQNKNLLSISGGNNIKMLLLKYKKLKQIQIYQKMKKGISVLLFVQKKSYLISGSEDASILIWSSKFVSNPKYMFKLSQHQQAIICIVVDPVSEDLIVSGSFDNTIKFWSFQCSSLSSQSQWSCTQTIDYHQNFVNALSINQEGNKLLSCSRDNQILIMEKLQNMEWQIMQRIQLDGEGFRISFITNECFAFQSRIPKNHLLFYQLDFNTKQYKQSKDIEVAGVGGNQTCALFFPMFYIDGKQILISKNGQNVNFIKLQFSSQIESYDLIQSINFGLQPNGWLFGTVSQDGELLITWDFLSRSIQIRKYKQTL